MVKKLDHIGIAVNNIEEQLPFYRDMLAMKVDGIEEIAEQGVKVCFLNAGGVHIELLQPVNDDSAVKKFLDKNGQGLHHIAYEVDNVEAELKKLKNNNYQLINDKPRKGAHGKVIAFIHPKSTFSVLTELCGSH